tara:strand:- start:229 stop:846 length:618 start_codon:yes stop_codon:yes gene_type:complete
MNHLNSTTYLNNLYISLYLFLLTIFGYLEIFYNLYILYFIKIIYTNYHKNVEDYLILVNYTNGKNDYSKISCKEYDRDMILGYDFLVFEKIIDDNNCVFFIEQFNNNKIDINNLFSLKNNKCFFSVEIMFDNSSYSIDLNKNNYFFKNNILFKNKQIFYLLEKHFNIYADMCYKVNIVDTDFNIITLLPNQFIFLNGESYEIVDI